MRYNSIATDNRPRPDDRAGHYDDVRTKPGSVTKLNGTVVVSLVSNGKARISSPVHARLQIDEAGHKAPFANMDGGTTIQYRVKPDARAGTNLYQRVIRGQNPDTTVNTHTILYDNSRGIVGTDFNPATEFHIVPNYEFGIWIDQAARDTVTAKAITNPDIGASIDKFCQHCPQPGAITTQPPLPQQKQQPHLRPA